MTALPPSDEVQLEHVRRGLDPAATELLADVEAKLAPTVFAGTDTDLENVVEAIAAGAPGRRFDITADELAIVGGGPQMSAPMPKAFELAAVRIGALAYRLGRPLRVAAGDRFLWSGSDNGNGVNNILNIVRPTDGGFYSPASVELVRGVARVTFMPAPRPGSVGPNRAERRRQERKAPRWQRR